MLHCPLPDGVKNKTKGEKKMKKVVYSVSRYKKGEIIKMTGIGYITDKDLVIACMSKKGNPYIRVFEDCLQYLNRITDKENEFKGLISEYHEVEIDTGDSGYETREIEIEYNIWYKYAD